MATKEAKVLSIHGSVVHGYIGQNCIVFPLQTLGIEVCSLHTAHYATHLHYQHTYGCNLSKDDINNMINALFLNNIHDFSHLITGYIGDVENLNVVPDIVKKMKMENPDLVYVCDTIIGDNNKEYFPGQDFVSTYNNHILPLADIITPNQFEAELLTNIKIKDDKSALQCIEKFLEKGIKTVVLSSVEFNDQFLFIYASNKDCCYRTQVSKINATFSGSGDVFLALFVAWLHKSGNLKTALENAVATVQQILRSTFKRAKDLYPAGDIPLTAMELRIIQNKYAIELPNVVEEAVDIMSL